MPLAQQFAQDRQGRRFADVLNDTRISFPAILDFFNRPRPAAPADRERTSPRPPCVGRGDSRT